MNYYSLNNPATRANFKEATIRGQAPDKGLYFPEQIPQLPHTLIKNLATLSREELAINIIQPYVGDTLPKPELERIVAETINFDFPLVPITPAIYSSNSSTAPPSPSKTSAPAS
jgi:threonine synthase